ncbi:uncharacterized protein LOC122083281 isoform X2 [Macadamia integrifolia]|uniref:uncharacterized protein LOC122083281 isoform X2 n=1 Tax=Macadamia integrifolia TaxID=60698 RepID=UPI001C4F65BE|nr:uncharacterized protein LOC122083281 isoform X2 [Macadamia integrifolia]
MVELDSHPKILNCIPNILQNSDRLMLDAIPLDAEIKGAVWDLDPDSFPGPDGFPGSFFRRCWVIINSDVANKGFFSSDVDSGNLLETVIEVPALHGGDLWDEELVTHEDGCMCDDCAFGAC